MVFPDDILKLGNHNLVEIQGTKFLEYFSESNIDKRCVESTQYVLSFVINGIKAIVTDKGKIIVNRNECVLIGKGNTIMSERIPDSNNQPYQNLLFFLSDDFIQGFYTKHQKIIKSNNNLNNYIGVAKTEVDPFISNLLISALMIINNKALHSKNILNLKLEELLLYLIKSNHSNNFKILLHQTIQEKKVEFRATILKNINHTYLIEDYAHLTSRSVSSFKRKFKETFGESAGKYFRKQKLLSSKSLLKTTDKTIKEIAFEVGYDTSSHFIRAFKSEFKTTPTQYRAIDT
ncbi:AraC family transcriptional regulator [uncultured Tenacibaculum sp.]|uniref:helix-turn-helix domain-containing protein n=1 Tax=uncultured Tenacibaculum sp. TaxID=174713 RepID=UPI00260ADE5C|nr:AraC family transcriptional regulator [uncultured Tenacibaculum sp.]